jgi:hypothetical protein
MTEEAGIEVRLVDVWDVETIAGPTGRAVGGKKNGTLTILPPSSRGVSPLPSPSTLQRAERSAWAG